MRLFISVCGLATFAFLGSPGTADQTRTEETDSSKSRDQIVQEVMAEDPRQPLAKWLDGQVNWRGEWGRPAEHEDKLRDDPKLREYRSRRDASEESHEDQMRLANWARNQGLLPQARVHAARAHALAPDPNDPIVLQRLVSPREATAEHTQATREEAKRMAEEVERGNQYWVPEINRLRAKLGSKAFSVRSQARTEIRSIADPFALPALVAALNASDLAESKLLIEAIAGIPSHHAAQQLALQALSNPWGPIREIAADKLRQRQPESWAPLLLASMETPISQQIGFYYDDTGIHVSQFLSKESQDRRSVAFVDSRFVLNPADIVGQIGRTGNRRSGLVRRPLRPDVVTPADNTFFGQRQVEHATRQAERTNESIREWNEKVCDVLRQGTGIQLAREPETWWNWWNDYNYIKPQLKQTDYYRRSNVEAISRAYIRPEREIRSMFNPSCLVPGTLISTDQGLIPIEEIRRGDLVLSQHPRTAELTYRPVLERTVREEAETRRVVLEGDSFTATSGHRFWVVGEGWVKTRDLRPGHALSTADGETRILRVESAEPARTYNLVVPGFNTYFVGPARILSHDVTIPTPVDGGIPGQPLRFQKPQVASR